MIIDQTEITVNGVVYAPKDSQAAPKLGPLTLVRTYSAGVHVGELVSRNGIEVMLKNSSRIWRWRGANSLSELSLHGPVRNEYTRISERVPEITLTQAIELIPVAEAADFSPVWNG